MVKGPNNGPQIKHYKEKNAELKIEFYEKEAYYEHKSMRTGYKELNLSDFINKGLQTMTFRMDKEG